MCRTQPIFKKCYLWIRGRGIFSDVPMYYRVRLSPTIKIEYGYFPYNWSVEFSEMKKLHIWVYGAVVTFSEFLYFMVELQNLYRLI